MAMDNAGYLRSLAEARDRKQAHDAAAHAETQAIYALIINHPEGVSKMELHRASGVSRPTIDNLLNTGRPTP